MHIAVPGSGEQLLYTTFRMYLATRTRAVSGAMTANATYGLHNISIPNSSTTTENIG
jgi:hypothetical protein